MGWGEGVTAAAEGNTYEFRRLENVLTDVSDRDSGARSIGVVLFWGRFFETGWELFCQTTFQLWPAADAR